MPIEPDDICLNKAAIMEKAVRRAREEFASDPQLKNYTHIDALTLNIQRACQAAIDLSLHLVSREHLGMPQTSADAFTLLEKAGYISSPMAAAMAAMTAFRNIAVHEYKSLDLNILRHIARERWQDFVLFCKELGMNIKP